jgi:hypothetical protein
MEVLLRDVIFESNYRRIRGMEAQLQTTIYKYNIFIKSGGCIVPAAGCSRPCTYYGTLGVQLRCLSMPSKLVLMWVLAAYVVLCSLCLHVCKTTARLVSALQHFQV